MTRRTDRIAHLIQREIGAQIQLGLRDPRVGFVTVSRTEVTTDLAYAKVYVTVLGEEREQKDTLAGLKSSAPFLRSHLARLMKTRTVPQLSFHIDRNLEHGNRIEELLRTVDLEMPGDDDRTPGKDACGED